MAAQDALNKVAKWRLLLVGRILGTRPNTDPPAQGFRDLFDKLICLRAEVNAQTRLLIEKGTFTAIEFDVTLAAEADHLDRAYEEMFPGWKSTPSGLVTTNVTKAKETMQGWPA